MKKILSIIFSFVIIATVITAFGVTVSAAEVSEKYYDYTVASDNTYTPSALKTDTIESDLYDIEKKEFLGTATNHLDVYEITKPCVIYGYFEAYNKDQLLPIVSNYEIALTMGEPKDDSNGSTDTPIWSPTMDWSSISTPKVGTDGGDFEYRKLEITDQDIINAGGTIQVNFGIRAVNLRTQAVSGLGQIFSSGVRIYTLKGAVAPEIPTPDKIKNPNTSGNSPLYMSGIAIPAPTYTVTIPKTIDFGECKKAMVNDTAENRIKEITVDEIKITHSNLFVNEKQVTVSLNSDFTIKNGDSTLNFDLYDGATKLGTNTTIITANPTAEDTNVSDSKTLTATLDKTQIKKSTVYNGVVTFTVALTDIA